MMTRLSPGRIVRGGLRRLARRTPMNIFWAPAASVDPKGPPGYSLVRITRSGASAADRALAEDVMRVAGEPAGLVGARLDDGDEMFGWVYRDQIVSFSWVTRHDRYVGPVRLADIPGRVFPYNAFTRDEHRGRGLYPAALLAIRSALGREGATQFVSDIHERNAQSAKGCEKAGFVPVARVAFLTIFSTWRLPLERTVSADGVGQIF